MQEGTLNFKFVLVPFVFPSQQCLGCWSTSMTADKQSENRVEVFKNQQQNTKGHHLDLTEVQSWIEREHKPPRINLQFLNAARRVLKTTNRSKSFHVNWYPVRVLSSPPCNPPLHCKSRQVHQKNPKSSPPSPSGLGGCESPGGGFTLVVWFEFGGNHGESWLPGL